METDRTSSGVLPTSIAAKHQAVVVAAREQHADDDDGCGVVAEAEVVDEVAAFLRKAKLDIRGYAGLLAEVRALPIPLQLLQQPRKKQRGKTPHMI